MKTVLKSGRRALAVALFTASLCGTASAGAGPPLATALRPLDCSSVPEIDPGSAIGAMTLLVGGLMTLADKRRAK